MYDVAIIGDDSPEVVPIGLPGNHFSDGASMFTTNTTSALPPMPPAKDMSRNGQSDHVSFNVDNADLSQRNCTEPQATSDVKTQPRTTKIKPSQQVGFDDLIVAGLTFNPPQKDLDLDELVRLASRSGRNLEQEPSICSPGELSKEAELDALIRIVSKRILSVDSSDRAMVEQELSTSLLPPGLEASKSRSSLGFLSHEVELDDLMAVIRASKAAKRRKIPLGSLLMKPKSRGKSNEKQLPTQGASAADVKLQ